MHRDRDAPRHLTEVQDALRFGKQLYGRPETHCSGAYQANREFEQRFGRSRFGDLEIGLIRGRRFGWVGIGSGRSETPPGARRPKFERRRTSGSCPSNVRHSPGEGEGREKSRKNVPSVMCRCGSCFSPRFSVGSLSS